MALDDKTFFRVLRNGGLTRSVAQAILDRLTALGGGSATVKAVGSTTGLSADDVVAVNYMTYDPSIQHTGGFTLSEDGQTVFVPEDGNYSVKVSATGNLDAETDVQLSHTSAFGEALATATASIQFAQGGGAACLSQDLALNAGDGLQIAALGSPTTGFIYAFWSITKLGPLPVFV